MAKNKNLVLTLEGTGITKRHTKIAFFKRDIRNNSTFAYLKTNVNEIRNIAYREEGGK